MFPGRSALPPYATFLQARLQMIHEDWSRKTSPGSPFLASLSVLANALRCSALMLAIFVFSGMLGTVPGVLPLLRGLSSLQLMAAFAHALLSRWIHHKTTERTVLSLSVLLAYGVLGFLVQQAVSVAVPAEPVVHLLVDAARWQGWHVVLDVADITPPPQSCHARPSLVVPC